MNNNFPYRINEKKSTSNIMYIVDFKRSDVNGDKIKDNIYLLAKNRPYFNNITLVIQNGVNNMCTWIPLKKNAGYSPKLYLQDYTGNGTDDILVSIETGGTGGYIHYYVYSYYNNKPKKIFDFEEFNNRYKYDVIYKDNYKVEVINLSTNIRYLIDISIEDPIHLKKIYDENGKLKNPIRGDVHDLSGLDPISVDGDEIYELIASQRISGKYLSDTLGYVQTILKWNGTQFEPAEQTIQREITIKGSAVD